MNNLQIQTLFERIKRFSEERDWRQFHDPKNLAISLQLEASEVLELFQWTLRLKVGTSSIYGFSRLLRRFYG